MKKANLDTHQLRIRGFEQAERVELLQQIPEHS